jgi:hypothetical protein
VLKWNPRPTVRDRIGEAEGEINNAEKFDVKAGLKILAKDGMALLQQHYPGWTWAIQINQFGRMMNIFCLELHLTWGYTIRIMEAEHDPTRAIFIKAGGEILERFKMPRAGIDYARLMLMKRDSRGQGIPILSDLEHAAAKKAKKKHKIADAIAAGRVRINPLTKAIEVGLLDG